MSTTNRPAEATAKKCMLSSTTRAVYGSTRWSVATYRAEHVTCDECLAVLTKAVS